MAHPMTIPSPATMSEEERSTWFRDWRTTFDRVPPDDVKSAARLLEVKARFLAAWPREEPKPAPLTDPDGMALGVVAPDPPPAPPQPPAPTEPEVCEVDQVADDEWPAEEDHAGDRTPVGETSRPAPAGSIFTALAHVWEPAPDKKGTAGRKGSGGPRVRIGEIQEALRPGGTWDRAERVELHELLRDRWKLKMYRVTGAACYCVRRR